MLSSQKGGAVCVVSSTQTQQFEEGVFVGLSGKISILLILKWGKDMEQNYNTTAVETNIFDSDGASKASQKI